MGWIRLLRLASYFGPKMGLLPGVGNREPDRAARFFFRSGSGLGMRISKPRDIGLDFGGIGLPEILPIWLELIGLVLVCQGWKKSDLSAENE